MSGAPVIPSETALSGTRECTSEYRIPVTGLADFACRRGDLGGPGNIGPSAREGIRAHQKVQARELARSPSTLTEQRVQVRIAVELPDPDAQTCAPANTCVSLSGRIDLCNPQTGTLTEIKSTLVPPERLDESQRSVHWAQAMLYGYCLLFGEITAAASDGSASDGPDAGAANLAQYFVTADTIELQLLYIDLRSGTDSVVRRQFTRQALAEFAQAAATDYAHWMNQVETLRRRTRDSARDLVFPHGDFRPGQRHMAASVWQGVRDRSMLLCEAPTGIGKTVSSLFPAIKALADGEIAHVSYLTAKTSGRRAAMQAVGELEAAGLTISAVQIRAKKSTCFCTNGRAERGDDGQCEFCVGFFDRLPEARQAALSMGVIDGDALDTLAWSHRLCPFELALQLLPWVSLAICDYNYVFDPLVRLGWYADSRRDTALLVDEAHNLPDRARAMYSAELQRSVIDMAARDCTPAQAQMARRLKTLTDTLLRVSREARRHPPPDVVADASRGDAVLLPDGPPDALYKSVQSALEAILDAWSRDDTSVPESIGEIFRALCRYAAIADLYGDNHRCICRTVKTRAAGRLDVTVTLQCLDAAQALEKQYAHFRCVSLFSATLRPLDFYREALGLSSETRCLQLPSPFDASRSLHLMIPWVDTRYRQRQASLESLCQVIHTVYSARPGNYLVFFPSYRYLQDSLLYFGQRYPDVPVWEQSAESDTQTRAAQLDALDSTSASLGFAILGGVFGEGVDYAGERLVGTIVVGVGLPGLGIEQDLIAEYCRSRGLDGYDHAYRYPGFTRVLQSAGRVIRSETDTGVIVLVDSRYRESRYRRLFPEHWNVEAIGGDAELRQRLDDFWRGKRGPVSLENRAGQHLP